MSLYFLNKLQVPSGKEPLMLLLLIPTSFLMWPYKEILSNLPWHVELPVYVCVNFAERL